MDEEEKLLETVRIPPRKMNYNKMLFLSIPVGNLTVMYDREVPGEYQIPPINKRNDFALWLLVFRYAPPLHRNAGGSDSLQTSQ